MESALTRPLEQRALPTITLLDAPLLEVLPARTLQRPLEQHDHIAQAAEGRDGHVWLDPRNAVRIVDIITEALAELDPDNATQYQTNALQLRQRLVALDAELEGLLGPLRERPCMVFHDSYQYLQHRYDLQNMVAVAIDPERAPGARRIRELRHWIQRAQPACIFAEPQFQPRIIAVLSEGSEMGSGVLDPLGSQLEPGADAYFQLMRNLARELAKCLAPAQAELQP
jgi:zinc transport system substrate-binding protein